MSVRTKNTVDAMSSLSAHVMRVASVIKSMRGVIFGEFVWRGVVSGDFATVEHIECHMPLDALSFLAPILRLDYPSTVDGCSSNNPSSLEVRTHTYTVWLPAVPTVHKLRVSVNVTPRRSWRSPDVAFDVDALAVDSDRMYVRCIALPLVRTVNDRLSFLVARMRERRFGILDTLSQGMLANVVGRAMHLIDDGWTMDDAVRGKDAWVLARWRTFVCDPASVRQSLVSGPPSLCGLPAKHDLCPLCHDAFSLDDLVINLACNHNFHCACPSPGSLSLSTCPNTKDAHGGVTGLITWFSHGHDTCPCCREHVS